MTRRLAGIFTGLFKRDIVLLSEGLRSIFVRPHSVHKILEVPYRLWFSETKDKVKRSVLIYFLFLSQRYELQISWGLRKILLLSNWQNFLFMHDVNLEILNKIYSCANLKKCWQIISHFVAICESTLWCCRKVWGCKMSSRRSWTRIIYSSIMLFVPDLHFEG